VNQNNTVYKKYELIISNFDGRELIKTAQLNELKIYYKDIVSLIENGYLEKVKRGIYRLVKENDEEPSEAQTIKALYPDGVLCMYTALFYYGYSDRTPLDWDIAIDRNVSKARFNIDYPYVKPHYMDVAHLNYGITEAKYEDCTLKMFDCDRLICECIRNENKMDRETYNKAIQGYVNDPKKSISNLIEYAKKRNMFKKVNDRIGVWL
jgi:predicted transcriptional regulator of viral defense system